MAFAELCPNFTVSKVQENLGTLQNEAEGLGRERWMGKGRERQSLGPAMPPSRDSGFLRAVRRHSHYYLNTQRPHICLYFMRD